MPKISIIVPVYKVELYIRECLDSIKQQTYTDWECLLIDDGSPDNSGIICDEYVHKDTRFSVFHEKNGGVSRARNIGLDNMSGEWVVFVDSDDVLSQNALEICIEQAESNNLDVLQFPLTRTKKELDCNVSADTGVTKCKDYVELKGCIVCVAGSFIHTNIIKNNNIRFNVHIKQAEDQLFIYECLYYAKRIKKIGRTLYWYRDNINSATKKINNADLIDSINILSEFKNKYCCWAPYIDYTNIVMIVAVISTNEIPMSVVLKLIKRANINTKQNLTGTYKLFYYGIKINIIFSYYLVKLKFMILR